MHIGDSTKGMSREEMAAMIETVVREIITPLAVDEMCKASELYRETLSRLEAHRTWVAEHERRIETLSKIGTVEELVGNGKRAAEAVVSYFFRYVPASDSWTYRYDHTTISDEVIRRVIVTASRA